MRINPQQDPKFWIRRRMLAGSWNFGGFVANLLYMDTTDDMILHHNQQTPLGFPNAVMCNCYYY